MTLFGWDASDWDWSRGPMDLAAARADGIDFFTHKASEGTQYVHGHCGEALARARDAEIPFLGAYMVPRTPGNGGNGSLAEQVAYFLANVTRMVPWWPLHPGWFWQMDTEHWYGSQGNLYDAVSPALGAQACQMLAKQTGRKVIHYAPKWSYGDSVPGDEPLWASLYPAADAVHFRERYAEVHGDSGIGWGPYSGRTPAVWQFTSSATIGRQPGCDANGFRGTLAAFRTMIGGKDPMADLNIDAVNAMAFNNGWEHARIQGMAQLTKPQDGPEAGADLPFVAWAKRLETKVDQLLGEAPVVLTDAQAAAMAAQIGDRLVAAVDNPLGEVDKPAIVAAVKQALFEGVG